MDPLSELLSLLRPQTYIAGGFDLNGAWSIGFDAHQGIKCWALVSGRCTLLVEGTDEPTVLNAGDCVLLPSGRRYRLAKDLRLEPIPFDKLPMVEWRGGVATLNGGGETMILGGHFAFAGAQVDLLLGAMPAVVRLREEDDKAGLRWALQRMRDELARPRPGGSLVVQHLAHLMLVQALRLYLAEGAGPGVGWLFGLADAKLAAAIRAIHADPGARWTLAALAGKAGMSRSTFAQRFKATTGSSPIEYLTQWRMLLAGDRLSHGSESVAAIAASLGYESEASFGTAFKRVMGHSPRQRAGVTAKSTAVSLWRPDARLDGRHGTVRPNPDIRTVS